MIGRIEGQLVEIADNVVLVAVGGVGYELEVTSTALAQLGLGTPPGGRGQTVVLYTHFVVREDAQQLFGFASRGERDLFRTLIRISGVGPKLALNLISGVSLADLAAAVQARDVAQLVRVPGVGKKTAERLLVELSGKLPVVAVSQSGPRGGDHSAAAEAERALVALGYRPAEAARAIEGLRDEALTAEELVRAALRQLARSAETAS
jgi:Holliday junction DNA helicase RuvA